MKKFIIIMSAFVLGLVALFISQSFTSKADGINTAGTADDPLITKSYLEQRLGSGTAGNATSSSAISEEQIKKWIQEAINHSGSTVPNPSITNSSNTNSNTQLQIIQLGQNQTLFAGAGAEFIVRTGKAQIISTDGNGVPDVTAGKDLANGQTVELNHLLVFPREGRGIKPDPKNSGDIFVMVRGTYLLVDNTQK